MAMPETRKLYVYAWGPRFVIAGLPVLDRKGEECILLARSAMNSALVEFADGALHVISRSALRKTSRQLQKDLAN